jgi:hypothetical protein
VAATLLGFSLWWTGATKELLGSNWPTLSRWLPVLLVLLAITTILDRSAGALVLGVGAIVVLVVGRWPRTIVPMFCLLLVCPLYLSGRLSSEWSPNSLLPVIERTLGEERAESLAFRLANEEVLMEKAFEAPTFGWAGWGRNLTLDKNGFPLTVPDSLWIIALGERGYPGLVALWLAMLLPVARYLFVQPVSTWTGARCSGATVCAVVVVLYMIDNMMNSMHNHVFIMMAGGLATLARPVVGKLLPPSITDRAVFQRSLNITRLLRSRQQNQKAEHKPEAPARDS